MVIILTMMQLNMALGLLSKQDNRKDEVKLIEYKSKQTRNYIIVLALSVLMFICAVIIFNFVEDSLIIVVGEALTVIECITLLTWYLIVMY